MATVQEYSTDRMSEAVAKPAKPTRLNRPNTVTGHIFWVYVFGFVALHLLALLAFVPWFFSWTGVVSVFVGN